MSQNQNSLIKAKLLHVQVVEPGVETDRRSLGSEHRCALNNMDNVARLLHPQGTLSEAEHLHLETAQVLTRAWNQILRVAVWLFTFLQYKCWN